MKKCIRCHTEKPRSEFHKDRSRGDGLQARCKPCQRVVTAQYREANRERVRAMAAERYRANIGHRKAMDRASRARNEEKYRAAALAWRRRNRLKMRRQHLCRKYGLSARVVDQLARRSCDICGKPPGTGRYRHHIDHDHAVSCPAGVRGVLCLVCNIALGHYERGLSHGKWTADRAWTDRMDAYLDRYESSLTILPPA